MQNNLPPIPADYLEHPEEMWRMLHSFISFFTLLGIVCFLVLVSVIITLILLLKSKAREKETGKYIYHVIQAQEEERTDHRRVYRGIPGCRRLGGLQRLGLLCAENSILS